MRFKILYSLILILLLLAKSEEKIISEKEVFVPAEKEFLYEEEEYGYAQTYFKMGKFLETIKSYEILLEHYPFSSYKPESYFMRGYIYSNNLGDTAKARINFKFVIDSCKDSEFYQSAKFELNNLGNPDFIPEFK